MIPGNPQAHLCATSDDVSDYIEWLEERLGSPLAIDTETTGLEWWTPQFTRLVTISDAESGWAIPVSWWGKVIEFTMERIVATNTLVVFHNAKFDIHALEVMRYPIPAWSAVGDTAILMHLHRSDLSRALKGKGAAKLLGNWVHQAKDNLKKVAKEKYGLKGSDVWAHVPVDEPAYWGYGVMDTIITMRLWHALAPTRELFAVQYQREMHNMAVMYRAEKRGVPVDENYTRTLQEKLRLEIERDLFYLQANGLDNPNSNAQVVELLETDYDFVPWEFTPGGNPSVNEHVLAVLAKAGGMQQDVVEALVRYKRNVKWKGTYVDRFLTASDIHGYIHPSINTMAARTGRSSIQGPPLQTLPSKDPMIRRCLKPHRGHHWYSLDYSNQEPRNLAHYSQSEQLFKYFMEGGGTGSIHDFVANEMFGAQYTEAQRSVAKVFGLARSYGAQEETLARGAGLSVPHVQRLLPNYDAIMGLDVLNDALDRVMEDRMPDPFIMTGGGRQVFLDPEKLLTTQVNFVMQGTGADQLKDAVVLLDQAGLGDFIIVPVHDELTFGFPKEEGEGMAREAKLLMEQAAEALCPSLPFPVDIDGPAKSWGAIYEGK